MPILSEYGSINLKLSREQAASLQSTGYVEVVPALDGRWKVTASSYVGSLVVDGVELLIRPKINPENLFLLLEPGLPPNAWRKEAFSYDSTSDLLPSVVAFFARTVETTLGRGILRAYESRQEPLVALRGRLDVSQQFKRAGVLTPVSCTFDDFSEDIVENRVTRAALRLALRVPRVDPGERQRLMRQLVALEGVSDSPVNAKMVDYIYFTRLNQHYEPMLGLARLILSNLTLTDAGGSTSASSFMVDMNDLFQRFLTERLRRTLRGKVDVVDEPIVHLDAGQQVTMRPDLEFRDSAGRARYVGDIKYKLAENARGRSNDYYQLLAYTTAIGLPEGMLIYCRRQGDSERRTVTVTNAGKRLVLRSIDLTGSPEQVNKEITALADEIRNGANRARQFY